MYFVLLVHRNLVWIFINQPTLERSLFLAGGDQAGGAAGGDPGQEPVRGDALLPLPPLLRALRRLGLSRLPLRPLQALHRLHQG